MAPQIVETCSCLACFYKLVFLTAVNNTVEQKIFFGALNFRPVAGVIWGVDSEKMHWIDRISSSFLDMVEYMKF
jgi:hypothetical protein